MKTLLLILLSNFACSEEPLSDKPLKVIISADPEEAHPHIRKMIRQRLEKHPEGHKAKLSLGQVYDQSKLKVIDYLYSIAILNAEGKNDGTEEFWRKWNWNVIHSVDWKNGIKHGIEKEFDGKQVTAEVPWVDGKLHGTKKTYRADGSLRSESIFVNGAAEGPAVSYGLDGKVTRRAVMKEGKREGMLTDYWPGTETVRREIPYKAGQVEGEMKEYYANGQLKKEAGFRRDALHGREIQYDADGKEIRDRYWFDGELVEKKEFKKRSRSE